MVLISIVEYVLEHASHFIIHRHALQHHQLVKEQAHPAHNDLQQVSLQQNALDLLVVRGVLDRLQFFVVVVDIQLQD